MATIDLENGSYREFDPFLVEFNAFLVEIGVPVAFTEYSGSNYFSVSVLSVEDVFLARRILSEKAQDCINVFFDLARQHGRVFPEWAQRECWEPQNVNHVLSFEVKCMADVVRKSKAEIQAALASQLGIRPKYVFCHSENDDDYKLLPGYVLFFHGEHDKLLALDEAAKARIRALCDEIVRKNDKTGFCKRYECNLLCCDEITHPDSLYGFSRED
ncbi:hypothetical protein LJB81_00160 [Desulfovibrio sp. OttesenSCG-928-M14]|nr:hypothetical protein [Desulfovibrio sp. OttesenSCG-928-M14]